MRETMLTVREWIKRVSRTIRPGRSDGELEEELRLHWDLALEDARRREASPEEAVRAARIQVGQLPQALEALRDQRGVRWLEDLRRDFRYACARWLEAQASRPPRFSR